MRAAFRRAFCFSSASSRSRRASIRTAARLALLLEVEEVAARRSCVVMCGRPLLKDEDGWCWWRSWRGGGERGSLGGSGSSFVLAFVGDGRSEVCLCLLITSEPETGGVGGRARFGGGDGRGGVVSFFALGLEASGVLGRDVVPALPLLRRFKAARDIDAERGLGTYLLPSPRSISRVGLGVDRAFGRGTSSATNITGLRATPSELGLPLEEVGDFGEYPVFPSRLDFSSCEGTVETGLSVSSVIFFQLALLDADDDVLVASGADLKSGTWICGRVLRSRRVGGIEALTTESIAKPGVSQIVRCFVRSSLSFRDIGYRGCLVVLRSRDLGLLIGPVHSVVTDAMIGGGSISLTYSLAYSLTVLMLGAIFGVALRFSLEAEINPSILLGSLHSRSGLFGGGGPGLSLKLLMPREAAMLGVRCIKTG